MDAKCPNSLQSQHYNISIPISKPPFVKFPMTANGIFSGSDVDIINIIKSKVGFSVGFKREKNWIGSAGSVSKKPNHCNPEYHDEDLRYPNYGAYFR